MPPGRNARQRLRDIEWALRAGLDSSELIRMIEGLLIAATPGSTEAQFGTIKLAELVMSTQPWRAAVLAKQSLLVAETAHGWALLGLAQSSLGNYRSAVKAYRRALLLVPENPWYCHNLGHLLDVAFNRPRDALVYLERAHNGQPAEPEISSSYAHALGRLGHRDKALALLERSTGSLEEATAWLNRWFPDPSAAREPSDSEPRLPSAAPSVRSPSR